MISHYLKVYLYPLFFADCGKDRKAIFQMKVLSPAVAAFPQAIEDPAASLVRHYRSQERIVAIEEKNTILCHSILDMELLF